MELNWFMIYTKSGAEKKVLSLLGQQKLECYWPHYKAKYPDNDKKYHSSPLLRNCVFVNTELGKIKDIKKVPGVVNAAYWLNRPAIITDAEITYLKEFLEDHVDVYLEKTPVNMHWDPNSANNIFVHTEKVYHDNSEQKTLTLFSLGYKVVANVKKGQVQIISSWNSQKNSVPYKFSLTHWILGN
ncbi:MAG: UpxY family transcription antiterminator [Ginsengibacter sp.]